MKWMKWNFLLYLLTFTFSFFGKGDALNDSSSFFSEESEQLRGSKKNKMRFSADALRAYIIPEDSREIVLVDIESGLETASIPLEFPYSILTISRDGRKVYLASEDLCEIHSVDILTKTFEKVASLKCPLNQLVLSKNEKNAYITYKNSNEIDCLNLEDQQLVNLVSLENAPQHMALDLRKDSLYVSYQDSNEIITIDSISSEILPFLSLESKIDFLTISPDSTKILTYHEENGHLATICAKTKSVAYYRVFEKVDEIRKIEKIGLNSAGTYAYLIKGYSKEIIPINLLSNAAELAISLDYIAESIDFYAQKNRIPILNYPDEDLLFRLAQRFSSSTDLITSKDIIGVPVVNVFYGEEWILEAGVFGGLITPTGTLIFRDGSTEIGRRLLFLGSARMTPSFLTVGEHSLIAEYLGDEEYEGSTSNTVTVRVNSSGTFTSLSVTPTSSVAGQEVTLQANVSSVFTPVTYGTVTFYDTAGVILGTASVNLESIATLSTSALSVGTHSLVAVYMGDGNFLSSNSNTVQYQVAKGNTTTSLSVDPLSSTFGEDVSLIAVISSNEGIPNGSVTFKDGSEELGTVNVNSEGKVNFSINSLSTGTHSLIAIYNGSESFNGSSSNSVALQVSQATTTTSLASTVNPSAVGEEITLTATVSNPDSVPVGSVTFMDGTAALGTSNLNSEGKAILSTSSLAAGKHSLTAVYNGNENYLGSTSAPLNQQVGLVGTSTSLTSNINPSLFGQEITLTAIVSSNDGTVPTGSVTFKDTTLDGTTTDLGTVNLGSTSQVVFSIASLAAGKHSLTAVYNGDGSYEGSTSPVLSQQVNGVSTTTNLTSNINPSIFGEEITLTATVSSDNGTIPAGIVVFRDKALDGTTTVLGTSNLNSGGVATLSTSSLLAGKHTLTAIYLGSGNYESSLSPGLIQQVNGIGTTTALTTNINPSTFGEEITLTATVSSNDSSIPVGTVIFRDGMTVLGSFDVNAEGVALFSTSSLSAGAHLLTAVFLGAGNYESSLTPILNQSVGKASTTTSLDSNSNPSAFGEEITLTATVSSEGRIVSTGSVTFMDGSIILGISNLDSEGHAIFSTASLSAGMHSLTATYSENENYVGSISESVNQRVSRGATTTSLTSSINPAAFGQEVILSATVSSDEGVPSGKVIFRDGTTILGISNLDSEGQAAFSTSLLFPGVHSLTAVYVGINDDFGSSVSSVLNQQIDKAETTITLTSSINPSVVGQEVLLTAAVLSHSTPTGNVIFMDGTTTLSTVTLNSEGSAVFSISSLAAGTHSLTAIFNENESYTGSTSNTIEQQVNKANTATTLSSNVNPSAFGEEITLTASISFGGHVPTGNVTFRDGEEILGIFHVNSGVATFTVSTLAVGSHALTATYSGDVNYNMSTSEIFTQVIESQFSVATTVLTSSENPAEFGTPVALTATVSSPAGIPTGEVTFFDGSVVLGVVTLNRGVAVLTVSDLSLGNHVITATYNGNTEFNPASSDPLFQIIFTLKAPQAPVNFRGVQRTNKFINYIELINILSWDFPEDNWGISSFEVYRDAELTQLVGRVPRAAPLELVDGNRKKNQIYTYYIISVSSAGVKSSVVSTTVGSTKKKGHKFK